MKKNEYTLDDLRTKMGNKYASVLLVASRAKAIRETPGEVEDEDKKLKPTVTAVKELMEDKLKFKDFEGDKIKAEE